MKNFKVPPVVYEMVLEMAKTKNSSSADKWLINLIEDQYNKRR